MKRKKQGASLIVVTIVFMFLTTVSFAMMSMILANYKARISESKRIENLYASDSGLDVAYNVIGKNFDSATKYGYYKVQTLKNFTNTGPNNENYTLLTNDINELNSEIDGLEADKEKTGADLSYLNEQIAKKKELIKEDKELQQVLINEEFKRAFKNFIQKTTDVNDAENVPDNQLSDLIQNHSYISGISSTNLDSDKPKETVDFGMGNSASPTLTVEGNNIGELTTVSGTSSKVGIQYSIDGHHETVEINVSPNQEQYDNITVKSDFYTEKLGANNNSSLKSEERQLEAIFKLIVPNYKDIYYQDATGNFKQYLATKDRAITVEGDMNVENVNNLEVNGEIFVEGTTGQAINVSNRSFMKYSSGIMVSDSSNIKFNDDVVTRNSFNIRNNSQVNSTADVTIGGNLYGRNVYIGGKYYDGDTNDNGLKENAVGVTLNVNKTDRDNTKKGQVVIDNDLGLQAQNSTVNIKDFYGVNDKNISSLGDDGNQINRVKSSSSIIVNSNDSSTINITNSAYIMGMAHLNTNETDTNNGNEYQTGESSAVKGNYIAYTVPLSEAEKFAYYDPLQLLDEPDGIKKAQHFADYWNTEIGKKHYPSTGGIQWPITLNDDGTIKSNNVYSAGAIVYDINGNKKVLGSNYSVDLEKQGGAVYNAQADFASKVYRFNEPATKENDYDKSKLTSFDSLVDISQITNSGYDLLNQNNSGEYAIFNDDVSKEVKVVQSEDNTDKISSDGNTILIKVGNKKDLGYALNAVIVTGGNLSISSGITINGCIIVQGNLNLNGKNTIKVNYDQGVTERVQAQNTILFDDVFGQSILSDTDKSTSDSSDSSDDAADYNLAAFLNKKLWKIIK